jgi:AraC family transcriptional regulator of adaptative response / DNA-3-methyladenine glycosylase II
LPLYRRTVALASGDRIIAGWVSVSQTGTLQPHDHQLIVQVSGSLLPVLAPVTHRLRELFDLDADPACIAEVLASDERLAAEVAAAPGLRMPGAWDRFELALRAVLGQQISVVGASTLAGRMAHRFGPPVATPFDGLGRAAPTAAILAETSAAEIAAIGMPRARAAAIRGLARFAADGGLEMAPGTSCEDAVAMLDALPGIGPWTAHYIAMRALRCADAFPAGDLGLRKAWALLDGGTMLPTGVALERRAEAWRPWRAYAAATLWHALSRQKMLAAPGVLGSNTGRHARPAPPVSEGSHPFPLESMAKPNYQYEKRQKDLAKQRKKQEKEQEKAQRKASKTSGDGGVEPGEPGDGAAPSIDSTLESPQ